MPTALSIILQEYLYFQFSSLLILITSKSQILYQKKNPMRWISYAIMMVFIVSMGVTPVFAQTSQQFTIQDAPSGKSYDVNYSITGATVDDMYISPQDTSLIVSLKSSGDGQLTLTMPRSLIDA